MNPDGKKTKRKKNMKTDNFHISNYGSFSGGFEADNEGYVTYHVSGKYAKMSDADLAELRDSSRIRSVRNACSCEINGRKLDEWRNK